jgi:glycosyltransferase involved in cell wall biosynthesis
MACASTARRCRRRPAGVNEWRLIRATEARLEQLARELRPDVLHAHSPVLNAIPAIRRPRLGIPVCTKIRAFWEDAAVDHGTTAEGSLRYRATRALETWAIKRVDHVFTICEGLRRDIVPGASRRQGDGHPQRRRRRRLPALRRAGRRAPPGRPRPQGKTVLGFVGSFYAYEGLDLLLDAFPALHASSPSCACCWSAVAPRTPTQGPGRAPRHRRQGGVSPAACPTPRSAATTT